MAILNQLSDEEIKKSYTHYALLYGFIPLYVKVRRDSFDCAVRNGWPDWILPAGDFLYDVGAFLFSMIDPTYEPLFAIHLRGKIK